MSAVALGFPVSVIVEIDRPTAVGSPCAVGAARQQAICTSEPQKPAGCEKFLEHPPGLADNSHPGFAALKRPFDRRNC
jgi:hypothetical protein